MDREAPDHVTRCTLVVRERLVLLLDLDGTLVPFADTPAEADLDAEGSELLQALADADVPVVVVSGRLREDVERVMGRVRGVRWVAEHGAWRHDGTTWVNVGDTHVELAGIGDSLAALAGICLGARVERKTASVCLHWRRVPLSDRAELVDHAEQLVDDWLSTNPAFERLGGVDMLEVRARSQHKGTAVHWVRAQLPDAQLIAIGDDVTDEDLFSALSPDDISIVVGTPGDRSSAAQLSVDGVAGVRRFLRWLRDVKAAGRETVGPAPVRPVRHAAVTPHQAGLVVVSNRTPAPITSDRRREVGGLVGGLEPALRAEGGIWLGWSGEQRDHALGLRVDVESSPVRACFDFSARQRRLFYGGFCNRSLWPMLHGLPGRVRYEDDEWLEYVAANDLYARLACELAAPDATIWIHDYHLLLVPSALRRRGHQGPVGLFLHVPFPSCDVFRTVPWAHELLDSMLSADLIGFHTSEWVSNFAEAARAVLDARWDGTRVVHRQHVTNVGAFPLPIDAAAFAPDPSTPSAGDIDGLRAMLGGRKLVLGVDRLDYSKGIPERLEAFERLLERSPSWRGHVTFVQISVPSRSDVPEYADLRARVEHHVGRINGRFGEADWVPVRYLYRSYGRDVLAQLYRLADVALVSPLRDGMNLVAKEFVAAQDPANPGVLVLSRFAGAAEELKAAILTNPFHRDGMAADLEHALAMPAEERLARHLRLLAVVQRTSPIEWAREFLDALGACRASQHRRSG